jgi:hypothetical protein
MLVRAESSSLCGRTGGNKAMALERISRTAVWSVLQLSSSVDGRSEFSPYIQQGMKG